MYIKKKSNEDKVTIYIYIFLILIIERISCFHLDLKVIQKMYLQHDVRIATHVYA